MRVARSAVLACLGFAVLFASVGLGQETQSAHPSRMMISLPDKTWGIAVDLTGFNVTKSEVQADGRRYVLADNPNTGVIFSTFLEEQGPGKSRDCKLGLEDKVKHAPFHYINPQITQSGDKAILEYTVQNELGHKVVEGNRWVCELHDNVFIDIHLSKLDFKKEDSALFDQIVDSISFHDGVTRSSADYMKEASVYYLRHDYQRAIPPYAQALALEKRNPQLGKTLWYVLVDNLGMAYGITGDLEKSRETFEYGIQTDSNYPLFYYNMACYYGEKRDAENVLVYLQKAFDRKGNAIPGEGMPDPLADDSFKALLKDKDFKAKVAAIAKGS